jgi:hypothetical protein
MKFELNLSTVCVELGSQALNNPRPMPPATSTKSAGTSKSAKRVPSTTKAPAASKPKDKSKDGPRDATKVAAADTIRELKDGPVSKKLGLKPGQTIVMIDAPSGFSETVQMPEGIDLHTAARRGVEFDIAILFVPTNRMLTARLGPLSKSMKPSGKLWIAYPKKGSTMSTDLDDTSVRKVGSAIGLIDDKVCVLDKTWSGLQFVIPDKAGK